MDEDLENSVIREARLITARMKKTPEYRERILKIVGQLDPNFVYPTDPHELRMLHARAEGRAFMRSVRCGHPSPGVG